ncbi:MAG: DUF1553 domain-containing protein [Acidobacteria bacterium]|nr:DUF1553 domain-containing protein [Acidobacteriota bacterium]
MQTMKIVPLAAVASALLAAQSKIEFNRDVRPILSDKCFACHGPDAKTKGVPLRLDLEDAAKGAAAKIVPRITQQNKFLRMPPESTGNTLSPAEIATLRAWVDQGMPWQKHWAFIPPARHTGSIDTFVRARLEKEGLKPSPEAPRETLVRRATLDITGLPPTPAELDRKETYEQTLDRLLASPRYGERMAARWLDAARYADTNGYQFDGERVMWRWRDYVIESFNKNKPYDKFVVEQIAGDMLPNATFEQQLATGFNRNHRGNTEDGIIAEEYAVEYVVDRVETTSAVFLGLTMGCARCHNHKYDPLTQNEFYEFFAYFNNVPERGRAMKYGNSPPLLTAPTSAQQAALATMDRDIAAMESALAAKHKRGGWKPAKNEWAPFEGRQDATDPMALDFDIEDRYSIAAVVSGDGPIASRKASETARGKGIAFFVKDGKLAFHINNAYETDALRVVAEEPLPAGSHHVAVSYSGTRLAEDARLYVDGAPVKAKFESDTLYRPFRNAGGKFVSKLKTIDGVQIYSRALSREEIAAMVAPPNASRLDELFYAANAPTEWAALVKRREERERFTRTFPTVMVMAESPVRKKTNLLLRGAYDKPGDEVEPGLPAVLGGAAKDRLELARWMASRQNPLTARVFVNRVWQSLFGTGLVKTAEDFGQQGEWPSHPELLDTLSVEFMESGWDVKALMKRIMLSATYRQSSKTSPDQAQRDPDNRLLARGPRLRLAAEMIRDAALLQAGLLHEQLGGPSVKPYQPDGLWKEVIMQDMYYVQSKGPDLYRRGLYTFWKRTSAPPMMMNFDASQREACMVRENRTNTPLQALNLMNDVTFLEAARFVGQRMMKESPDRDARLRHGFRIVVGRAPSEKELAVLRGSLAYHLDHFASRAAERDAFLANGDSPPDAALDKRELAAYMAVASLLMNTDEAVTKE